MKQSESINLSGNPSDEKYESSDQESCQPSDSLRDNSDLMQLLNHQQRLNISTHLGLGISHQINHPLSASVNYIHSCIELMQKDDFDRNKVLDLMSHASQESYRAAEMIQRLRRFVSNTTLRLSTMNFNHAVLETVALISPLVKEHQIELKMNLTDELPLIIGDRIQLEQVIFNLIINSIQSIADSLQLHGTINIESHLRPENKTVELHISDNGPGIDIASADKLFEPFYTTKKDCLGVGLTLCKAICQNHAGSVSFLSQKPQNCIVVMSIPLTQHPTETNKSA